MEKSAGRNSDALDLVAEAYFQAGDPARAAEAEDQALRQLPAGADRKAMESRLARYRSARK